MFYSDLSFSFFSSFFVLFYFFYSNSLIKQEVNNKMLNVAAVKLVLVNLSN